jgi:hypothetical protein
MQFGICCSGMGRRWRLRLSAHLSYGVRVPGFEARRSDLMFQDWEGGRDLYIDVVGASPLAALYCTGGGGFVPGGGGERAGCGGQARLLLGDLEISFS